MPPWIFVGFIDSYTTRFDIWKTQILSKGMFLFTEPKKNLVKSSQSPTVGISADATAKPIQIGEGWKSFEQTTPPWLRAFPNVPVSNFGKERFFRKVTIGFFLPYPSIVWKKYWQWIFCGTERIPHELRAIFPSPNSQGIFHVWSGDFAKLPKYIKLSYVLQVSNMGAS